jgi:hypothetical protein
MAMNEKPDPGVVTSATSRITCPPCRSPERCLRLNGQCALKEITGGAIVPLSLVAPLVALYKAVRAYELARNDHGYQSIAAASKWHAVAFAADDAIDAIEGLDP